MKHDKKRALQYIVGLNKTELVEVGGETYSDKSLHRVKHNPKAESLWLYTLTSLMDYIESGADEMADKRTRCFCTWKTRNWCG